MENYINQETIIKDSKYEDFKDRITCPLCQNLMIKPLMCIQCKEYYCDKCIDLLIEKKSGCPNQCSNSNFKEVIEKNNLITKFKFKCIHGCDEEISFYDIENHYDNDCKLKSRIAVLNKNKVVKMNKPKEEIEKVTSKFFS